MDRRFLFILVSFIVIFLPIAVRGDFFGPFDASGCRSYANNLYTTNPNFTRSPGFMNTPDGPAFSPELCRKICRVYYKVPSNSVQRLLAWFVPIISLAANIPYPKNGWSRFLMVFFVLGNPIFTILSLLLELDSWGMQNLTVPASNNRGDMLSAYASLLVYFWQVVTAFVEPIGGGPEPSGGMLGPAMQLSYLNPMVLLSTAVGRNAVHDNSNSAVKELSSPLYRPDLLKSALKEDFWLTRFPLAAAAPVLVAYAAEFIVLFTKPTYFTCRHIVILLLFSIHILNFVITATAIRYDLFSNESNLWWFNIVKDVTISCLVLAILIGFSFGLFTSCYCLSGFASYPVPRFYILLSSSFDENDNIIYPATVSVCIVMQYGIYRMIRWFWKNEFDIGGSYSLGNRILEAFICGFRWILRIKEISTMVRSKLAVISGRSLVIILMVLGRGLRGRRSQPM
jgi:hypothetical protein